MNSSTNAKLSSWHIPRARETVALPSVARVVMMAFVITAVQFLIVFLVAIFASDSPRGYLYDAFCQWDGVLYGRVVRDGYRTTIPPTASVDFETSNVAFFPGYPLLGHAIRRLSDDTLSIESSLVLGAQLAAWGSWTYWLLFLRRFRIPRQIGNLATLAIVCHPGSFYLVVAYSESLFLFSMLGFFYWMFDKRGRWGWAVPHGIVMSASRLGGLPVAFVPLIAQLMAEFAPVAHVMLASRHVTNHTEQVRQSLSSCRQAIVNDRRRLFRLAGVGLLASLGGLAFFAYCKWTFGYWDMYFWTQKEGAAVTADWFWWMRPSSYAFFGSVFYDHWTWPDDLSRFFVGLTAILLVVMARWEIRLARSGDETWPERLPYFLAAAGLFFLHAAGVAPIQMQSMFRYCLVVHVLLLLELAHACGQGELPNWLRRPRFARLAIGLTLFLAIQGALVWRYFSHQWVA